MPDISKVNAVAIGDVSKIAGVAKASISKYGGADVPSGTEQATTWLIGANSGRLYANTSSLFTSSGGGDGVEKLCDFGSENIYGVAIGLDAAGEKRWVWHGDRAGRYIHYISASADWTSTGNWTYVNDYGADGKPVKRGGPGLVYVNEENYQGETGYWYAVGGGRHQGDNVRFVMMSSSQTQMNDRKFIEVASPNFIGTSNTGYAIVRKESNTLISPLGVTHFYKSTNADEYPSTWASQSAEVPGYEVYCMGYDPDNDRWVAGTNSGKLYHSGDEWATLTASVSPFGTSNVWGVIYVKGSINKWVAIASNGKIAHSVDGVAFTASTLPAPMDASHHMRGIASDHTTIVAVGAVSGGDNNILTSSNGTDWTYVSSSDMGNVNFESVCCDVVGAVSN